MGAISGERRAYAGLLQKEANLSYGDLMNANILVVDVEESIRFSFHRFLAAEGHNVITATGYREALKKMRITEFDLILADVFLGDGWGLNILQEVKSRNLNTRVIIMTAYPSSDTAKDSLSLDAADYLVKPLTQKGLIASVNKVLNT